MPLNFNDTDIYVLRKAGYSSALLSYWKKIGFVPNRHIFKVESLTGRSLEFLCGGRPDPKESLKKAAG